MTHWQHQTAVKTSHEIDSYLNEQGFQGWELVTAIRLSEALMSKQYAGVIDSPATYHLFLKRGVALT